MCKFRRKVCGGRKMSSKCEAGPAASSSVRYIYTPTLSEASVHTVFSRGLTLPTVHVSWWHSLCTTHCLLTQTAATTWSRLHTMSQLYSSIGYTIVALSVGCHILCLLLKLKTYRYKMVNVTYLNSHIHLQYLVR